MAHLLGVEKIEIFFKYLVNSTEVVDKQDYAKALSKLPEGEDKIMTTLAQEWKNEGRKEGREEGVQEGKIEGYREMLISAVQNRFGIVKPKVAEKIRKIQSTETLHSLFNQIFFVEDENKFKKLVDEVISEEE